MFVYLSKLIPPLLYPLGLSCLLILAGLWSARRPRLQRALLLAALLLLWLSSTRMVAYPLVYALESRYRTPPELANIPVGGYTEPIADVILLLGGGTDSPTSPRPLPEINESGDRLIYAAYLYQQGVAPKILVSGGGISWLGSQLNPAADMQRLLQIMGVPPEARHLRSPFGKHLRKRSLQPTAAGAAQPAPGDSADFRQPPAALGPDFSAIGHRFHPGADRLPGFRRRPGTAAQPQPGHPTGQLAARCPQFAHSGSILERVPGILAYWLQGWL
jgi:hypothetical protein